MHIPVCVIFLKIMETNSTKQGIHDCDHGERSVHGIIQLRNVFIGLVSMYHFEQYGQFNNIDSSESMNTVCLYVSLCPLEFLSPIMSFSLEG